MIRILIEISLKFVSRGTIDNNPALILIMAWRYYLNQCRPNSLTHICGTRGRWVQFHLLIPIMWLHCDYIESVVDAWNKKWLSIKIKYITSTRSRFLNLDSLPLCHLVVQNDKAWQFYYHICLRQCSPFVTSGVNMWHLVPVSPLGVWHPISITRP